MKKLGESLKGLFIVNAQAGYLRFIFTILLIFILWSLLAIISSIYNPLGDLIPVVFTNINSSSLALSLFRDILKAYFSIFTLSILLLIIFIFWLTFVSIASFYSRLITLPTIKEYKNYLSSCAFSISGIKKYQFPDDHFMNSKEKISYSFPEGPIKASIKPKFALVVNNRGIYRTWVNSSDLDNMEKSLEYQDKIIDCFDVHSANLQITMENKIKEVFQSPLIKIELAYSYQLPVPQESNNQLPNLNLFELCDSINIRSIIEKIIISEVKATLTQFSMDSRNTLPFQYKKSPANKIIPEYNSDTIKPESKTNAFAINFFNNPEKQVVKRNRKRPMYLIHRFYYNINSDKFDSKISPTLIESLNDLLTQNIRRTMEYLFNSEIIEAKIIAIGKQEIK